MTQVFQRIVGHVTKTEVERHFEQRPCVWASRVPQAPYGSLRSGTDTAARPRPQAFATASFSGWAVPPSAYSRIIEPISDSSRKSSISSSPDVLFSLLRCEEPRLLLHRLSLW